MKIKYITSNRKYTFFLSISLRGSRRLSSVFPNKHTFKFPSAVRRNRLQDPQKFSVIDVIKPIRPLKPIANDTKLISIKT